MKIKAILKITVSYDVYNRNAVNRINQILDYAADHLASQGLLSDDTGELEVSEWSHTVTTK